MFLILVCENPKSSASLFLHDDWSAVQQPHFSHSLALVVFSLSFSFLLFPLAISDAHPPALPGHSSRRVHFERINTVPIKGQRAARRSTRRHHSLSRTLLRYGRTTPHVSQAGGVARFGWVTGTHTQWFLCIFTRNFWLLVTLLTESHMVLPQDFSFFHKPDIESSHFLLALINCSLFRTVTTQLAAASVMLRVHVWAEPAPSLGRCN